MRTKNIFNNIPLHEGQVDIDNLPCSLNEGWQDDFQTGYFRQLMSQFNQLKKPLIVLVGGATGVGKTSIATGISKTLDIDRVINSDVIREIMRYMLPAGIVPTLHESSFTAGKKVKNPLIKKDPIYGFSQQTSLVSEGVQAYIRRNVKEGLNTVMNGVHLIPGYLNLEHENGDVLLFHYILHLEDQEQHIQRFYQRSEGSRRDPDHYIRDIDAIRKIQTYIKEQADQREIPVIENVNFEKTLKTILTDISTTLEEILVDKQTKSSLSS